MKTVLILIQILDKGNNPPFIKKIVPFLRPLILDADGETFIQKGQFPQTLGENIEAERDGFKNLADPA